LDVLVGPNPVNLNLLLTMCSSAHNLEVQPGGPQVVHESLSALKIEKLDYRGGSMARRTICPVHLESLDINQGIGNLHRIDFTNLASGATVRNLYLSSLSGLKSLRLEPRMGLASLQIRSCPVLEEIEFGLTASWSTLKQISIKDKTKLKWEAFQRKFLRLNSCHLETLEISTVAFVPEPRLDDLIPVSDSLHEVKLLDSRDPALVRNHFDYHDVSYPNLHSIVHFSITSSGCCLSKLQSLSSSSLRRLTVTVTQFESCDPVVSLPSSINVFDLSGRPGKHRTTIQSNSIREFSWSMVGGKWQEVSFVFPHLETLILRAHDVRLEEIFTWIVPLRRLRSLKVWCDDGWGNKNTIFLKSQSVEAIELHNLRYQRLDISCPNLTSITISSFQTLAVYAAVQLHRDLDVRVKKLVSGVEVQYLTAPYQQEFENFNRDLDWTELKSLQM